MGEVVVGELERAGTVGSVVPGAGTLEVGVTDADEDGLDWSSNLLVRFLRLDGSGWVSGLGGVFVPPNFGLAMGLPIGLGRLRLGGRTFCPGRVVESSERAENEDE